MGLFKKVKGFVGGITGATAQRTAVQAGEQQARAIREAQRAYQQAIPGALQALTAQTLEAQQELRPFTQPGISAMRQLQQLAGAPGAEYTPAAAYVPAEYETPTAAEVAASPAAQFRMQQAQRALEMGAAARGGLFGGAHQRQLAEYMQGLASQEYEQETQRRLREAQFREAQAQFAPQFAEQQAQFAPQLALQQRAQQQAALAGLTGMGLEAAGQLGGIRERFGQQMAGIRTGSGAAAAQAAQAAGQARASGALAGAQARQQAMGQITGLAGTVGGMYLGGPGGAMLTKRFLGG